MEFEWETTKNTNAIRRVCYTAEATKAQTSVLEQRTYTCCPTNRNSLRESPLRGLSVCCGLFKVIHGQDTKQEESVAQRVSKTVPNGWLIIVETIRRISNADPSLMRTAWGDGVAEVDCSDDDGLPSSSSSSSSSSTATISATVRHGVSHQQWDAQYLLASLYNMYVYTPWAIKKRVDKTTFDGFLMRNYSTRLITTAPRDTTPSGVAVPCGAASWLISK